MNTVKAPAVVVWAALVGITLLSWILGHGHEGLVVTAAPIALAMVKIRLVGIHFMELRSAPVVARVMFESYVVILGVALICLALAA